MFNRLKKDELVQGSIVLVIMIGLFNILNYVFQISMARMLGPAQYSIFAVLMSMIYIFGISNEAIQTVMSKYTCKFNIQKNYGKIKDLLYRALKKSGKISVICFLGFLLISLPLSYLLKIDLLLIILTGLFIPYSFIIAIMRGVLQGRKKFFAMGGNMVLESFIKTIFSVVLVFIGFSVYGAIGGLVISAIIAILIVFIPLKDVLKFKREEGEFGGIFGNNLATLIAVTSIVLMYSIDIVFARVFFAPEIAGKYAFVSLIGKTILFASFAIGKAMFPLSSEKFENKGETKDLFKKSIVFVSLLSITALICFLFFPEFVIKILSLGDTRYLDASNILFILGLSFSFASFSYILSMYRISVNKMGIRQALWLIVFVIVEAVLLILFSNSLFSFSISVLAINSLVLLYNIWLAKY